MVMVGFKEVIGSWNTIAILRPRISFCFIFSDIFTISSVCFSPVNSSYHVYSIEPLSMVPLFARIPIIAFVVTDLPEPLSPTIASVSPLYKSMFTPRIAFTWPLSVLNDIFI